MPVGRGFWGSVTSGQFLKKAVVVRLQPLPATSRHYPGNSNQAHGLGHCLQRHDTNASLIQIPVRNHLPDSHFIRINHWNFNLH